MSEKHLPVIGSTAATTDFVSETVTLDGRSLTFDGNQKISGWKPRPNAFSLRAQAVTNRGYDALIGDPPMAHEDCPSSTETCRASCYVGGLEKAQKAIYALYQQNSQVIREILAIGGGYAIDWADFVGERISKNCAEIGFRFHVSGDVFSAKYARWISEVCRAAPTIRFWIYTRSFDFVADLIDVATVRGGNLALNLSADRDNYARARQLATQYGLRICYLTVESNDRPVDLRVDDVLFPDYPLRPKGIADPLQHPWWSTLTSAERRATCPVDAFGKSEQIRCGVCTKCLS